VGEVAIDGKYFLPKKETQLTKFFNSAGKKEVGRTV